MVAEQTDVVMTVRGPIPANELGFTLPHEHLWMNAHSIHPGASTAEVQLSDYQSVYAALRQYQAQGGNALAEATPEGCGRRPLEMRALATELGLNIICCTGWYLSNSYPSSILDLPVLGRADILIRELSTGIGTTNIQAGFIKIGCSAPIDRQEEVTLKAAAVAQKETGASLHIHITNLSRTILGWYLLSPEQRNTELILTLLKREGVNLNRVVLCHADGTYYQPDEDLDYHLRALDYGVTLSFDQFGHAANRNSLTNRVPAADSLRISGLARLVERNYASQLLISHNISSDAHLASAGPGAYAYIGEKVIPMLQEAGVTPRDVRRIVEENPRQLFSFPEVLSYGT